MKARLALRSVIVMVVAAAGFVVAGTQPSLGTNSPLASATITSPVNGEQLYGADVTVEAQAQGQEVDPPHKIQFFVDHSTQPSGTATCYTDLANPSYYCGAQWLWRTSRLVGHHSVAAKVVLLDGRTSSRSTPVHVIISVGTRLKIHRHRSTMVGHKMVLAGRVTARVHGRPGARHMPVVVSVTTRRGHVYHLRTDSHGRYRKTVRATTNASVNVTTTSTRTYQGTDSYGKTYYQYVRGRPHCRLSQQHARVHHVVVLRCRLRDLPAQSGYQVQNRVHGKWREAAHFKTLVDNGSKLYIRFPKPATLIIREVFARSPEWDRSTSNVVRLHVT